MYVNDFKGMYVVVVNYILCTCPPSPPVLYLVIVSMEVWIVFTGSCIGAEDVATGFLAEGAAAVVVMGLLAAVEVFDDCEDCDDAGTDLLSWSYCTN